MTTIHLTTEEEILRAAPPAPREYAVVDCPDCGEPYPTVCPDLCGIDRAGELVDRPRAWARRAA